MSLVHLNSANFHINYNKRGDEVLCTNIPRFSIILFYTKKCIYCRDLLPKFKQLPMILKGCVYCLCDVGKNKNIPNMASGMKIRGVPYIVLYSDGKPIKQYTGEREVQPIANFIYSTVQSIQSMIKENTKSVSPPPAKKEKIVKKEGNVLGIPYNADDNKYLKFSDAYGK